ncbi:MAG: hypothetical protein RR326_10290, partial [Stenotrophomonas sp.]
MSKNKSACLRSSVLALAVAAAMAPLAASAQTVDRQADGVVVAPANAKAAKVRLQLVDQNIIRVSADVDGDFQRSPSLMRVANSAPVPAFEVSQDASAV